MNTFLRLAQLLRVLLALSVVSISTSADVRIERARLRRDVVVRVLNNNDSAGELFVPYCGDLNNQRYLCDLAVQLQTLSAGQWSDAATNCNNCALLGGIELDRSMRLEPGRAETFEYAFPVDYFKVSSRQKARLRISVWRNLESMKNREAGEPIYSAQFELPKTR